MKNEIFNLHNGIHLLKFFGFKLQNNQWKPITYK